MTDDVDIQDSLKFLRERGIVYLLRFREAVEILKEDHWISEIHREAPS